MNPSRPALLKAIQLAGSQSALARLLGKSQPLIFKWLNSPNGLAPEHCAAIERVFPGAVTRRDLRPNDWHLIWPELAEPAQEGAKELTDAVK
ncbi:hypothetical protein C6T62_24300 [Burkholderia multivorans]|nr:hypothetical protein C6T62_24300 [Burkholderia multivorans]